jgi:hypothetical protein
MAAKNRSAQERAKQILLDIDRLADDEAVQPSRADMRQIASFGPKTTPGKWEVVFDESKPREIPENDKFDGPRLGIDVTMRQVLPDGSLGSPEELCIFMRVEKTKDKNGVLRYHSLTNGILVLYKENDRDLKGVKARIVKRVYDSDRPGVGETCAYDVRQVHE